MDMDLYQALMIIVGSFTGTAIFRLFIEKPLDRYLEKKWNEHSK